MLDPEELKQYNGSSRVDPLGKCHLCGEEKLIRFCRPCGHWFCLDCRRSWLERAVTAVREQLTGPQPSCCGPLEEN